MAGTELILQSLKYQLLVANDLEYTTTQNINLESTRVVLDNKG